MSRTQALLGQILAWLTDKHIPFRLVGQPPTETVVAGSDVDILVPAGGLAAVGRDFPAYCVAAGLPLLRRIRHTQGFRFDLVWENSDGDLETLPIDFSGDLCAGARCLVQSRTLLADPGLDSGDGALRLPPSLEFQYYLAKKIRKGRLDGAEAAHLGVQWHADPAGCRARLDALVGHSDCRLISSAAQSGDWEPVRTRLDPLCSAMRAAAPVSSAAAWRILRTVIERLVSPAGLVVAVSGTAATSEQVQKRFAGLFPTTIRLDMTNRVASGTSRLSRAFFLLTRVMPLRYRNTLVILDGCVGPAQDAASIGWVLPRWPRTDLQLSGAGVNAAALLDILLSRYDAPGQSD